MNLFERVRAAGDSAREWAKVAKLPDWWRRADKSAERRAVASRASPFLGHLYQAMAMWAWFLEFGFAGLWAIRANGEFDWTWSTTTSGDRIAILFWSIPAAWGFNFSAHVLPAFLTLGAVGLIVGVSVTWIPAYFGLAGMGRARRGSVLVAGPLCTLFAALGAIVVTTDNAAVDARDATSVQQHAVQSHEALERQYARVDAQLTAMRDRRSTNEYAALAATVGEAQYRELYMSPAALAREPDAARRQLLTRAVGAAVAADRLVAEEARLNGLMANAPTEASLQSTTHEVRTAYILSAVQWASDNRVVMLGALVSMIGLLWWWLAQGLKEAVALLNPAAPEEEAAQEAANAKAAESDDDPADDPEQPKPDELTLPPLPDLRGVEDAEFDAIQTTVDESGRRLRRVSGSWRPEKEAPRSRTDTRRPPGDDDADDTTASDASGAAGPTQPESADADDVEDIIANTARRAQQQADERAAKEAAQ